MPMVTSPPVQRYMWGTRPSNFSTRGITREESISVDQRITDGEGRGGAVSRLLNTYRFTMPGVKAAKPNLWPPMNADKNQNALPAFIGIHRRLNLLFSGAASWQSTGPHGGLLRCAGGPPYCL